MNKEGMEELLVIGEDVFEEVSVDEHDDYIIVPDPENEDEDAWAVLILRGKYENFVVRFENVAINTETEEMIRHGVGHGRMAGDHQPVGDHHQQHTNNDHQRGSQLHGTCPVGGRSRVRGPSTSD